MRPKEFFYFGTIVIDDFIQVVKILVFISYDSSNHGNMGYQAH